MGAVKAPLKMHCYFLCSKVAVHITKTGRAQLVCIGGLNTFQLHKGQQIEALNLIIKKS